MGKVKAYLMDLMDEAIANISDYEDFNSWCSAYRNLDEEELRELWDEQISKHAY